MKFGLILFSFFILSILLVVVSIERNAKGIYQKELNKIKMSSIQHSSAKTYARARKVYVPKRSVVLARKEIENILLKEPIGFEVDDSSFLEKSTLTRIVKVVNHIKEEVVLTVLAHTDAVGTAKHNLYLSQKRADKLKAYFRKRTNLPLIVAIGYGEAFSLKNRLIEINLKRIKP